MAGPQSYADGGPPPMVRGPPPYRRPPQMGHTQNLGLADSTLGVKNAAKNFGEYFRKLNDLPPLDDAIYEEFADDNLKAYCIALVCNEYIAGTKFILVFFEWNQCWFW